jgi:hypothetical protein
MSPRAILRVDGLFETALGLVLAAGAATGVLGPADFPTPVGTALVLIFGCALLPVGALLWRLSQGTVASRLLRLLAAANLGTGAAALAWRLAASGFSAAGSVLTISAAGALALLACAQLRSSAGIRQRF